MATIAKNTPPAAKAPVRSLTNRLLAAVGAEALTRLLPQMELVTLAVGDVLYAAGTANEYVYFPEDTVISHVYFSEAGASVEAAMVGREGASGLCGMVNGTRSKHTAVAIFGGAALRARVEDLAGEMIANQPLQSVLYEYTAAYSAEVGQRVACGAFHMADERLCSWLLTLQDRAQNDRMIITHEEMATFLGINRASISSIAKRLKDKGLINYVRGKLSIIDRPRLESLACECYSPRGRVDSIPRRTHKGRSNRSYLSQHGS